MPNAVSNREKIQRETMPAEVALEMLCRPGVRMTNRERKSYWDARTTRYQSTLKAKPLDDVLAFRLHSVKMAQLNKWFTRCVNRRKQLQAAYNLAKRQEAKINAVARPEKFTEEQFELLKQFKLAVVSRAIAAIDLKAAQLDAFFDAVETERNFRLRGNNE